MITGLKAGVNERNIRHVDISRFNGSQFRQKVRLRVTSAQPLQGEARDFARVL
jgi:hypothetical protein